MRPANGFTLIEIIFVTAVLGVLATISFRVVDTGDGSIGQRLEARDAVLAELRRVRVTAASRLPPASNGTIAANLEAVASPVAVNPPQVVFSYEQGDAARQPSEDLTVMIGSDSDPLSICIHAKSRFISKGACL